MITPVDCHTSDSKAPADRVDMPTTAEIRKAIVKVVNEILAVIVANDGWERVTKDDSVFDVGEGRYVESGKARAVDGNAIKKNVKKFTKMLVIAKEMMANLTHGSTMMKRELFYRHTDIADNQVEFDQLVQEMCYRLKLPRHALGFVGGLYSDGIKQRIGRRPYDHHRGGGRRDTSFVRPVDDGQNQATRSRLAASNLHDR